MISKAADSPELRVSEHGLVATVAVEEMRPPAGRRGSRLLVAGGPSNETNLSLVAAWGELGVETALVPPGRLRDEVAADDVVLARLDVLPTLDGVEPGLLEVLMAERRGCRVLNPARVLLETHDKLRTARRLAEAGLPHPRVSHVTTHEPPIGLDYPVVVKPRFGSWGKDVVRCETPRDLALYLDRLGARPWFRRHGALVQELIPPQGYDLRVIVAGGRTVGAIERIAAPGEWRTNISLGGSKRRCAPSAEASAVAAAAAAAIGADLVGVDLLPAESGYIVIELNGAVEFDPGYSLPGSDIYRAILAALKR